MNKAKYRVLFQQVDIFLKWRPLLLACGIQPSAFSRFMKDETFNYELSEEKLSRLYEMLRTVGQQLTEL